MRYGVPTLACALAAAAALGGCGGSSPARRPSSETVSNGDAAFIAFTRCMRAHGVQMADPYHREGHAGLTLALPPKTPATTTAYGKCTHYIQPVINAKQQGANAISATVHLGLVRYAQCMRSHDIPMLDPTPQGNLNLGNIPGMGSGFGRYSPQFRAADRDCRHLLPAQVGDNGTGP
jgi:hypothetical protein